MNAEDRALLVRAHTLLLWCQQHWANHSYEGSPSVLFLSRIDGLLEGIRERLLKTAPPEEAEGWEDPP